MIEEATGAKHLKCTSKSIFDSFPSTCLLDSGHDLQHLPCLFLNNEDHHHSIYIRTMLLKSSCHVINQHVKLNIAECQGASSVVSQVKV